eukprot:TRINITY_DN2646_c3_g1_i1.p1 TRINITY_DN2646_c3_g1~~TRINITY_DN2646_c3_g1_i1.p1  ORF type:complete len:220 (+),score=31.72 TRINITY_DN2646_c3_g1_i1:32-661(+)
MVNSNRLKFYSSLFGVHETQRKIAECGDDIASACSSSSECSEKSVHGKGGKTGKVGVARVHELLYGLETILLVDEKLKEQGEVNDVRAKAAQDMMLVLFDGESLGPKAETVCNALLKSTEILKVTPTLVSSISALVTKRVRHRVALSPDIHLLTATQLRHLSFPHPAVPSIVQSLTGPQYSRREALSLRASFSPPKIATSVHAKSHTCG